MGMGNQFSDFDPSSVRGLPNRERRGFNVFVLPMLLIGGSIGILAGYGALSLMGVKGFGSPKEPAAAVVPVVVEQPPARPVERERAGPVARRGSPPAVQAVAAQTIPTIENKPAPRVVAPELAPAEIAPTEIARVKTTRPNQTIRLDLDKTTQREAITLKGNIRIVQIDGCECEYKLSPETGQLPVEVTLEGPRPVMLKVSIDKGALAIMPTVKNDSGKLVPFTVEKFDIYLRRIMKTGKSSANRLASMKAEHAKLKASLGGGVTMAYLDYKAATARFKQLEVMIPQAEQAIVPLEAEAKETQSLFEFARQLDGKCTITIESSGED